MRDLIRHAAQLGVRVHLAPIDDDPELLGYYSPAHKQVVVRVGMTRPQSRWVLAHELGHAYYDHHCSGPRTADGAERQADAYAARLIIDPNEYARLERINPDQHWLADEFGVSVDAITAYEQHCLTRVRGATYTRARLGIGQWVHRSIYA